MTRVGAVGAGQYEVDFGRNIAQCTAVATIGLSGAGAPVAGEVYVADRSGNAEAVFVDTNTSAGAAADRAFRPGGGLLGEARRGALLESAARERLSPRRSEAVVPRARARGAGALARGPDVRAPARAAPRRGRAGLELLRRAADGERQAGLPSRPLARRSRTSTRATARCAATTCRARPAGTATGSRSSSRSRRSSGSRRRPRSRPTGSASSTSAAASPCCATSRTGTGSPSGSASGSTSTTRT